jgi:TRAP-type transport system small permease protein
MSGNRESCVGRGVGLLVRAEQLAAVVLLAIILGTMATQVVARYVLGSPFSWSEELARFALVWLAMVAACFVMAEGSHLAVDVVSARLSPRGKLVLECFGNGVVIATCLVVLIGGSRFVWYVGRVGSPALGIPMSWWYGAASFGSAWMAFHSLMNLIEVLRTGRPVRDRSFSGETAPNSPVGGAP